MDAALRLIQRDGILAGLNMAEVAQEAGVNRGLIHHYFGTRRALLLAALERRMQDAAPDLELLRALPPDEKAGVVFREYQRDDTFLRLLAMLALDGDDDFEPMPFLEESMEDGRREQAEGSVAPDVDLLAMQVVWESTLLGYFLLREAASRQVRLSTKTLDRRVQRMLAQQLRAVTDPQHVEALAAVPPGKAVARKRKAAATLEG